MKLNQKTAKRIVREYEEMSRELEKAIKQGRLDDYCIEQLNIVEVSEDDYYIDRYVSSLDVEYVVTTDKEEHRTYVGEDITIYDDDDYAYQYTMDDIRNMAKTGKFRTEI
jgi:hypothetical protein